MVLESLGSSFCTAISCLLGPESFNDLHIRAPPSVIFGQWVLSLFGRAEVVLAEISFPIKLGVLSIELCQAFSALPGSALAMAALCASDRPQLKSLLQNLTRICLRCHLSFLRSRLKSSRYRPKLLVWPPRK